MCWAGAAERGSWARNRPTMQKQLRCDADPVTTWTQHSYYRYNILLSTARNSIFIVKESLMKHRLKKLAQNESCEDNIYSLISKFFNAL